MILEEKDLIINHNEYRTNYLELIIKYKNDIIVNLKNIIEKIKAIQRKINSDNIIKLKNITNENEELLKEKEIIMINSKY